MKFDDYKIDKELTESDYKALVKLSGNKDFERFRGIVEDFQIKRSFNLIAGHVHYQNITQERELRGNELLKYSGAYDLWQKMCKLVDNSKGSLEKLKEEEENEENKS